MRLDRAVDVAANDALDLGVTRNGLAERIGAAQPRGAVTPANAGAEWRVVHEHERWARRGGGQARLDPRQPGLAKRPANLSGHDRIERQQAQRVVLDRVVQEGPLTR